MLAGVVGLLVLAVAGYVVRNLAYARWDAWRAERAGFVEKRTTIDGSTINYAEGPDNGPPLLLIHGQATTWQSWHRVLPDLSERFHVFAVDVYGHGKSARVPEKYTARAIAADMEQFLTQVVGEPATVSHDLIFGQVTKKHTNRDGSSRGRVSSPLSSSYTWPA